MRLFQVYSAGNFIEATPETPYFQVGESKYGKPVLDRVITPETPLDEAAKCALVSMDSTLKSNLSVGLPLDLVVYEADRFGTDKVVCIDENNPYFRMLHDSWGQKLREVFDSIEDPAWNGGSTQAAPSSRPMAPRWTGSPATSPARARWSSWHWTPAGWWPTGAQPSRPKPPFASWSWSSRPGPWRAWQRSPRSGPRGMGCI